MRWIDDPGILAAAGICALSATAVSGKQLWGHLTGYTEPVFQRFIVRILFMCPVYALVSFVSLLDRRNSIWYDTCRDCYEAWLIYNFLCLLLSYVGGDGQVAFRLSGQGLKPSLAWGTCCLPDDLPFDGLFLRRCRQGALQFVIVKPLLAGLALLLYAVGGFGEGSFRPDRGFVWIMIVYNVSYSMALYALLLFYIAAKDLLKPFNPVFKFITVKFVVFLTFWQGLFISMGYYFRWIDQSSSSGGGGSGGSGAGADLLEQQQIIEEGKALQNVLICFEMLLVSFLLLRAFPTSEYARSRLQAGEPSLRSEDEAKEIEGCSAAFDALLHALNITDVIDDAAYSFAPSYGDYVLQGSHAGNIDEAQERAEQRERGLPGEATLVDVGETGGHRGSKTFRLRTFIPFGAEMLSLRGGGQRDASTPEDRHGPVPNLAPPGVTGRDDSGTVAPPNDLGTVTIQDILGGDGGGGRSTPTGMRKSDGIVYPTPSNRAPSPGSKGPPGPANAGDLPQGGAQCPSTNPFDDTYDSD